MKKQLTVRLTLALVTTVTLLACISEVDATPPTPTQQVPIHGRLSGSLVGEPVPGKPGVFRFVGTAEGVVSHMGRVVAEVVLPEVTFEATPPLVVLGQTTWTGKVTAANGDELHGTYTVPQAVWPIFSNPVPSTTLTLAVTGGTGRFRNATGTAGATATVFFLTQTFEVQFEGTISRPRR